MKRFILFLIISLSWYSVSAQQITGAVINDVKVVKKAPTGILILKVSPKDAVAYVDGIKLNGADEVKLDVGTHTLYVEASGYISQEKEFTIEKDKTCIIEIILSNADKVTISTNVPSLRKIDGIDYPEELTSTYDLTYGKHTVEFSATGYKPLQKNIEVNIGGKNFFHFNLQEAPKEPETDHGDIIIETNVPSFRKIDGKDYAIEQVGTYEMTWGEHALSLSADGYYSIDRKLNIEYLGKSKYHFDLTPIKNEMTGTHEIGAVVGGVNGISYKYWFTNHFTLQTDLAVGFTCGERQEEDNKGKKITDYDFNFYDFTLNPNVAYNFNLPANFKLYVGGGINFGLVSSLDYIGDVDIFGKFGINAITGVSYYLPKTPISLSLDFRPGYGLQFGDIRYDDVFNYFDWKLAFSIRYCLK